MITADYEIACELMFSGMHAKCTIKVTERKKERRVKSNNVLSESFVGF